MRRAALAEQVKETVAKVTTTTLYVREEPNTDCSIVTSMPMGEELEVVEQLDGWVKVSIDSDEGYVSADYIEINTELPTAMTMTEVRYGQGVSDVRVGSGILCMPVRRNPYVGGTSLTRGADCSGFVMSVFANYGVSLPHSSGFAGRLRNKHLCIGSTAEICSSMVMEAGSIMWRSILETDRWYMQVPLVPESKSPVHATVIR